MKFHTLRGLPAIGCALALFGAAAAHAVDGVNEINHTSILAAGGYPFVIANPGSYVITSNLTPPVGTGALAVAVSEVEIDLNGFTLLGAGGGAGVGIAGGLPGLTVKDGTIVGFGGPGIVGGPELRIFRTRVTANGAGIVAAGDCLIVENVILGNAGFGIDAFDCKIENNVIRGNQDNGIIGQEDVIVHNKIADNGIALGGGGVLSFGGSTIQENVLVRNFGFGISDTPGAPPPAFAPPGIPFPPGPLPGISANNIMKNVVEGGGGGGSGIGIFIANSALITDNTVTGWDFDGVVCGVSCTIRGNQVNTNNLSGAGNGVVVGPGSTVNDNSIGFNAGIGLLIDPTALWSSNSLNANGLQDMSLLVPPAPLAHPTSGLLNLCSGVLGPVPGVGPGACP